VEAENTSTPTPPVGTGELADDGFCEANVVKKMKSLIRRKRGSRRSDG